MNDSTMPPPPNRIPTVRSEEDRHMNDSTMPPPRSRKTGNSGETPRQRRKVAGAKRGFGMHDWALLKKSAKDLAQRKGAPLRRIRMDEISQHSAFYDGWVVLKGKVYNLSPYLPYHPGGEGILRKVLGKDATPLFDRYHRWVNIDGLIGDLQIGYLDRGEDGPKVTYLNQSLTSEDFAIPAGVPKMSKAQIASLPPLLPGGSTNEDDEDDLLTSH